MPDLTDYQNPFTAAGQAFRPQAAPPPTQAAPRQRSLFDDPRLAKMMQDFGNKLPGDITQPNGLPGGLVPANDPFGPINKALQPPANAPIPQPQPGPPQPRTPPPPGSMNQLVQALQAPAGKPANEARPAAPVAPPQDPSLLPGGATVTPAWLASASPPVGGPQAQLQPPGQPKGPSQLPPPPQPGQPPPVQQKGGSNLMQQMIDRLSASTLDAPAAAMQDFVAPHQWSVGPARRMGETMQQAGQRETADYQGRLGAAQAAQQAQQFGTTAQLTNHAQQMNTLNELMKSQSDKMYQQQHLDLQKEELKHKMNTDAYLKGPQAKHDQRRLTAISLIDAAVANKTISRGEGERQRNQWDADNPTPTTDAPSPYGGGANATPPSGTPPPPPGLVPPPGPGPGGRTLAQSGLPGDIQDLLVKTVDPENKNIEKNAMPPEDFMTKAYQYFQTHPQERTTGNIKQMLDQMSIQYGPKVVEDALRPKTLLGGDVESGMNAFKQAADSKYKPSEKDQAAAAFRNARAGIYNEKDKAAKGGGAADNLNSDVSILQWPGYALRHVLQGQGVPGLR